MLHRSFAAVLALSLAGLPSTADAQGRPHPAATVAAQKEALAKLSFLDGLWRGSAWTISPSGERHTATQTERVGPFLDGAVKVIEGLGYETAGKVAFNALGVISYNPSTRAYSLRSYAMGMSGDYVLTLLPEGFAWEIPAGPMTIRYTATVKDGTWHEVGDRVVPGKDPVRFMEMTLKRIGDTTWPAGGAVAPD